MNKSQTVENLNTKAYNADLSIRLDLWLWRARFFKSRTIAARFLSTGNLRIARMGQVFKVRKSHIKVSRGDQLTFMIGERLFQIEVQSIGKRRGPAPEAQTLYAHISPVTSEPLTA